MKTLPRLRPWRLVVEKLEPKTDEIYIWNVVGLITLHLILMVII